MKTSTLLLVVSLVANAALVAAVVLNSSPAPAAAAHASAAPGPAAVASGSAVAAARVPVANLWSRLHAGNLDEFRDRLRAAGFPPGAVRVMLSVLISEERQERSDALRGKVEDLAYWKNPRLIGNDPEMMKQFMQIDREYSALFGKYANSPESLAENEDELVAYQRRFGRLPVEKLRKLVVLERDLEEKRRELNDRYFPANGRSSDPEAMRAYREASDALDKSRLAEAGQLLTPEELEQYELRNSPLSGGLRSQLAAFSPTEAEFKALYALRKNMPATPEQFMDQMRTALGPERYADYEVAVMSGNGDKLPRLLARLELPLSSITTINSVRSDINQRAQIINNDQQLTPAQRESQLAGLATEAGDRLTSTLGARGYEAYADLKGDWIRALKPRKK